MKAIIENGISRDNKSEKSFNEACIELVLILNKIMESENEKELRQNITIINGGLYDLIYFIIGFGGSHMWVKELDENGCPKQQVIFVEF